MKPIIAITPSISPVGDEKRTFSPASQINYLNAEYERFVEAGGGIAMVLSPTTRADDLDRLFGDFDGVIVSGGADVDPGFYGEERTKSTACNADRDRFELEVIRIAREKGRPILGICRGMQILNIAYGGKLYQDIYDHIQTDLVHHRDGTGREQFHTVTPPAGPRAIEPPTKRAAPDVLTTVFRRDEVRVNSTHHQSVSVVGEGLIVTAVAPDGVVEAIASTDDACVLGVQWHPERMHTDELQRALGEWFVAQCSVGDGG